MKSFIGLFTLCLSLTSFAEIRNSNLDPRHDAVIEDAVYHQCGVRNLELSEVSSLVDWSELGDEFFAIKLNGTLKIDQAVFVDYAVEVKSAMLSMYDHDAKDWGFYQVLSVYCASK